MFLRSLVVSQESVKQSVMEEETLNDEKQIMDRTWQRKQALSFKDGFREGAIEGQEKGYQNGFDSGYKAGFESSFYMGLFNGAKKILGTYEKMMDDDINDKPFENIHKGACFICSNGDSEYRDIESTATNQKKFLRDTLKAKLSYSNVIDKYVQ